MSRASNRSPRSGFSIAELMVVISIIALLLAILLPTVSAARRRAQSTRCLSAVRQIAFAATLHEQAHVGYYPVAGHFADVPTRGTTAVPPDSIGDAGRRRYMYLSVEESFFTGVTVAPWQAAVAHYMGKKNALTGINNADYLEDEIGSRAYLKYFMCPSHQETAADVRESMIYAGGNLIWMLQQSYVINEAVFGINDAMGRLRGKASRVRRPAATMMLMDGLQSGPRELTWRGDMNWVTITNRTKVAPVTLADALAGNGKAGDPENFDRLRHRGRTNIVFFDGHAEARDIRADRLQDVFILPD